MKRLDQALVTLAVAADPLIAVAFRPHPAALARGIRAPRAFLGSEGVDHAVGALVAAALWATSVWLAVGLLAALAATAPGLPGRVSARLARRLLPAAVYRAGAGVLGLSVVLAPVIANAQTRPPAPASAAGPLWPTDSPLRAPMWPQSHPAPSASTAPGISDPAPSAQAQQAGAVTVEPGDCLWLIAARRLGSYPTASAIAAAWPRWYAENRSVIGADPNLILPGTVLRVPVAPGAPAAPRAPDTRETR